MEEVDDVMNTIGSLKGKPMITTSSRKKKLSDRAVSNDARPVKE